jgi:FtsZ-binding cell division protein ZapB
MHIGSDVGNKLSEMRTRVRERRMSDRVEDADHENERLRTEVRLLRQELDQERGSRERLLSLLERMAGGRSVEVKQRVSKRGGMLRTLVLGGAAYVLGTRAGRERYHQIVERVRGFMRSRSEDDWGQVPSSRASGAPAPTTGPTPAPSGPATAPGSGSTGSGAGSVSPASGSTRRPGSTTEGA